MRRTALPFTALPFTALPLIALLAVALTGCGSGAPSQPRVSAFAAGTCRAAAPDVLALGAAGQRLGTARQVDGAVRADLRDAQAGLRALAEAAEPAYQDVFAKLVASTGFVRIRADGNSYDPAVGKQMMADYAAVLRACQVRS